MSPPLAVLSGCSSGIGLGIARRLLSKTDMSLVCLSRRPSQTLDDLTIGQDHLRERVKCFEVDALSDELEDQLRAAKKETEAWDGKNNVRLIVCSNGLVRRPTSLTDSDCLHLSLLSSTSLQLHPEKAFSQITARTALESFKVNTLSHLLTYAHFTPLIPTSSALSRIPQPTSLFSSDGLSVCMSLTARVASISDNRSGGWTSYRSSKAASNAAVKNLALELSLRKSSAIAMAYHPGTVKTALSAPFVPSSREEGDEKGLFNVDDAVGKWEALVRSLTRDDTGGFRDWKSQKLEW